MPVTQEQLGDTMGLTSVHVNRTLRQMREQGLVSMHGKHLTIHDPDRLRMVASCDSKYLHLSRRL